MTTDENIFNNCEDEDTNTSSNSSNYGSKGSTVVTYTGEAYDLDIKRFHIGGAIIKHICSKCGEEIVEDLEREYLMDSTVNAPIKKVMYCSDCSQEDIIFVKVSLNIELLSKDAVEPENLPVDPDSDDAVIAERNNNPILDSIHKSFFDAMDQMTGYVPNDESIDNDNNPVISKDENLIDIANEVFGGNSDEVKML